MLLGVLTFWLLPNTYQQANWLTPEEKQRIADDLARDDAEADHGKHSFRDGFFNLKVWMLGGIDFAILLSAYAMGFWMPTFIKTAGVTDITTIGYLTAIPSVAALLGMLLIGSSSDRLRERRWHIIVPFIVGALAMAGSTFFTHNALATVLLFSIAGRRSSVRCRYSSACRPPSCAARRRRPASRWPVRWPTSPGW